jgi:hypothetical protein
MAILIVKIRTVCQSILHWVDPAASIASEAKQSRGRRGASRLLDRRVASLLAMTDQSKCSTVQAMESGRYRLRLGEPGSKGSLDQYIAGPRYRSHGTGAGSENLALKALGVSGASILFFRHGRARPGHPREHRNLVISL